MKANGWNLPPGCPQPRDVTVELRCRRGHRWEAAAVLEFGRLFLAGTAEDRCPECGGEGEIVDEILD